jgi:hypothetical protein
MEPNGGFGNARGGPSSAFARARPRGGSSSAFVPRGPWRPVQRRRVGAVAGLNAGGQRFAGDDGKPDPRLAAVLSAYAAGREGEHAALAALAGTRLLMPLVAFDQEHGGACGSPDASPARETCGSPGSSPARETCGSPGSSPARESRGFPGSSPARESRGFPGSSAARESRGFPGSSAAREMAFPTLIGRDGRPALLAFTSLDALTRWRADARPVPALAAQVWETAVADSCAVVIDVAGPVPLAVDGARLGALAKGEPPPAPQDDPDVHALIAEVLAGEPGIAGAELAGGGAGADLAVRLMFRPGGAPPPGVQRAAEAIAAGLAGRLRRGIEISAVPAPRARR